MENRRQMNRDNCSPDLNIAHQAIRDYEKKVHQNSLQLNSARAQLEKQIKSLQKYYPNKFKNADQYIKELNKFNIRGRKSKINHVLDRMEEIENDINALEK